MPTLVSFWEVQDNRDGGTELVTGRIGAMTNNTHTRSFVAEFLPEDGPSGFASAVASAPVPSVGDVYVDAAGNYDFGSFCAGVKGGNLKAPWIWLFTASYTGDIDLSNPSGDPLLMPPVFSWGDKSATRPATLYDADGNEAAGLNSAGDPFDPPATDEETWTTLEISKNLAFNAFDPVAAAKFKNCVNSDAYLGFRPGEVLCVGLPAETDYQKGVAYWKVKGKFEIKRDGADSWALKVLDRGFQGYDAVGTKRVFVDQATGRALSGASLLDGTGKQLPRGGVPVFLTFYVKLQIAFAGIGLP